MSKKTRTGWVYVLVNESIPNQVKVGFTSGHPEDRASDLRSTGVPTPYKLATAFLFVDKAYEIEQRTHSLLKNCRVSPDREFFRCEPMDAADAIRRASEQLNQQSSTVEPVLLTPEEIAKRERKEAECRRIEAEERQRQRKEFEAANQRRIEADRIKQHATDKALQEKNEKIRRWLTNLIGWPIVLILFLLMLALLCALLDWIGVEIIGLIFFIAILMGLGKSVMSLGKSAEKNKEFD